MARYHAPHADDVVDRRISAAVASTKPARSSLRDHLEGIRKATPDQKAAALAYLTRKGLDDIAQILGLVDEQEEAA